MTITLRQLEIFIAVVEEQQVTRASERLFLTQSAVSLALSELENQLGGPLFDRDKRSLNLNDRGRYLLPLCRETISKADNIYTLMNEKEGNIAGALNIVASSTIGNYVLPSLASAFKTLYPYTYISVKILNTRLAEQLIIERKVDLGLSRVKSAMSRLELLHGLKTNWLLSLTRTMLCPHSINSILPGT